MTRLRNTALLLSLLLTTAACAAPGRLLRGYAEAEPTEMEILEEVGPGAPHVRGQVRFAFDGFGSLSTDGLQRSALPWKLLVAALALDVHERTGEPLARRTGYRVMEEHGFLTPRRIANWEGRSPRMERPLGVVSGVARRGFPSVELEIAGFGCPTCHAGPLYGADGEPTGDAWLGIPNASMDLSGLGRTVTGVLDRQLARPDALLDAVARIYPEVSEREIAIMRDHVLPAAREKIGSQVAERGYEPTFEHGGPGLMNGIGGLRSFLGLLGPDAHGTEVAWVSPPALSETTMRKSLLVDATYAPAGSDRFGPRTRDDIRTEGLDAFSDMVTLFVMTTFNVDGRHARDQRPAVHELVSYLDQLSAPRFPGVVDTVLAAEGEQLYLEWCASCHGTYSPGTRDVRLIEHPNRFVAQDRMGTDPARWAGVDAETRETVAAMGWQEQIADVTFGGYVAPDLTGVWATAPYLHNGSVPTLWHLLNAEERPDRFMVGGHALDFERMGIRGVTDASGAYVYPEGYDPWSRPMLYDTREPGRSNTGHAFPGLSAAERAALLEYMKVL